MVKKGLLSGTSSIIFSDGKMVKQAVFSKLAPHPVGPYSQAVFAGPFLFLSGQIPLDPENQKLLTGDIRSQTERVMKNIKAVLQAAQMDFFHVIKTSIFLKEMNHFSVVNDVYGKYFTEPFPARSCVAVQELPKGADIEIELIAFKKG